MDCIFRFLFVLMEDRRCLYGWNRSLPLDNVLSQGGGPLAVEGVLLNRDEMYHTTCVRLPQSPTGASSLQEGAFGVRFPILVKQISAFLNWYNHRGQR